MLKLAAALRCFGECMFPIPSYQPVCLDGCNLLDVYILVAFALSDVSIDLSCVIVNSQWTHSNCSHNQCSAHYFVYTLLEYHLMYIHTYLNAVNLNISEVPCSN